MAEEFAEVRRNITAFLMSLRQSVDRPFRGRAPAVDEQRERFMRTMMIVEEARIRFNIYTRYREEPTRGEWDAARKELLAFVDTFTNAGFVEPDVYDRPFIFRPMIPRDRERPSVFMEMFTDRENRLPVSEALVIFRNYIEDAGSGLVETQGSLSLEDLDRIVPRQQVAPVQFDIVDGRIIVASRVPKSPIGN
ncbi:hypothetical protein [Edaphosphingomonas haloaromaticamans]|uniref:Uncharacterized protein n=1 Tax=Edaphosphingomonas haloaromaticamans TaxID=653954 RepID=A0A1S1HG64_9SPHN|nr:hypothetical protein [Sphingomonas haloaromaticamans]OHT21214.1 hypothetical protein BHE75_03220 [Sphingomonas haloaromaticamans]